MALTERLKQAPLQEKKEALESEDRKAQQYQETKTKLHQELIQRIDLSSLFKLEKEKAREEIRRILEGLLAEKKVPLNHIEERKLLQEVENETFGLGPLEPLLADPTVSDILVNHPKQVFVERFGKLEQTDIIFRDEAHLRQIIDRIVSRVGRRIDESQPMVDARLPDGSRVNAIIPPLALNGSSLSIRRFKKDPLKMKNLISLGTVNEEMAKLLEMIVKARLNLIISGGTGSGKTTLLNVLSGFIPNSERVITIEDAAELQLQQSHVVRLETRPTNLEGKGEIKQRDLVRNALRMRPDRIIIGEVRGVEALDMLQAMNTGHEGSLTTIHANSPRDALYRLETMILMAESNLVEWAINRQIASAIDLIIQISRMSDGVRRMISLSEITGMEGEVVSMQDVVVFESKGITPDHKVMGNFKFTGIRPRFLDRLKIAGLLQGVRLPSFEEAMKR
ncbi:MAG: Flp pilus assembly complex ATPase component TadA [Candidatus Omnitrophica bacterium]|nr:Flp pilus assembly complex ATPase component TadA [Candidatus Omnitrophota bacterium]